MSIQDALELGRVGATVGLVVLVALLWWRMGRVEKVADKAADTGSRVELALVGLVKDVGLLLRRQDRQP